MHCEYTTDVSPVTSSYTLETNRGTRCSIFRPHKYVLSADFGASQSVSSWRKKRTIGARESKTDSQESTQRVDSQ
jgi:hypothetical protein